mmetsp:Transcript_116265/g.205586  ORF Transcript_116265/g.205586 Transcript_116265/m.205586 type:complete len:373 (+) Transcript_116265:76-1194(+)
MTSSSADDAANTTATDTSGIISLGESMPSSLARRRNPGGARLAHIKTEPDGASVGKPVRNIENIVAPGSIEDIFEFREGLHESASSNVKVMKAKPKETDGPDVIVKMRSKKFAAGGERVFRQVLERMLNLDNHTNVLGLSRVIEDDKRYYLIMERCSGGELFDFLQTETDVPESECKRIMREILQGVDHIHSKGLIHRDIKPENIMFTDASADPVSPGHKKSIKLIDFDTCQEYEPMSPKAKHVVGTMGYIAPEALKGEYTPASDLWSVGVILYILMTGDMPFDVDSIVDDPAETTVGSSTMEQLYEALKDVHIDFECEPWPSFPQARDLCMELLAFSADDRSPSAKHALQHPWLREAAAAAAAASTSPEKL